MTEGSRLDRLPSVAVFGLLALLPALLRQRPHALAERLRTGLMAALLADAAGGSPSALARVLLLLTLCLALLTLGLALLTLGLALLTLGLALLTLCLLALTAPMGERRDAGAELLRAWVVPLLLAHPTWSALATLARTVVAASVRKCGWSGERCAREREDRDLPERLRHVQTPLVDGTDPSFES